jgi:hypothetical protein
MSPLRVGERVLMEDRSVWRVTLVNACRARVVPEATRHVVIETPDGLVEFDAPLRGMDISPNSILRRAE